MTDSRWTSYEIADALSKVIPSLGRLMAHYIRESGGEETTMMQVSVLFHIQKQPMTASELAKKRRVSLQAASVLVQGLVERGWVTRLRDPNDRRQFLLQITADGLEHTETVRRQITNYMAKSLDDLTAEEMAAAQVFLPGIQRVVNQQMMFEEAEEPYST
ncbi:MAG: MarR family transcriptional regulator [Anaerolineaceae bacterium]|nr:MarR family transcriptional regulator [Anaerolineaceae bacterium]